jgi:signal peptidase II
LTAAGRLAAVRAASLLAGVLIVDQTTKALVRAGVERGSSESLLPGVDLVNTRNTGVAFSMFQGGGTLLIAFTAVAMVAVLAFFLRRPDRPLVWLPVGLLLGGAVGNLIDRVLDGSVTDFIDLPLWPAFNVADMAITVGVATLLYVLERHGDG